MTKIATATYKTCTQRLKDASWKFARGSVPQLEGHVLEIRDEDGHIGIGYVHAIPAISGHGGGAAAGLDFVTPMLVGQEADDIAAIMNWAEATLAFNVSVKAALDMALHDLLARKIGVPLNLLLGGKLRNTVAQSRILAMKSAAEMGAQAESLAAEGYRQLKLKLSGDTSLDVARIASVRKAAGDGVTLTLDPNQSYNAKQMMSAFAKMETFGIALIEQPVPATDWPGLALLTKTLPVAIEADESAQTVHDVFRLVTDRVVDVVNLKITKLGGIRNFQNAVRICEAGGVVCRMGAAFGPALLQSVSLQAASTIRSLPFACELSEHQHLLDDPFTPLPVVDGAMEVRNQPGSGVDFA